MDRLIDKLIKEHNLLPWIDSENEEEIDNAIREFLGGSSFTAKEIRFYNTDKIMTLEDLKRCKVLGTFKDMGV